MKTANIAYAKAHLSEILHRVQEGESVLITDRRVPVAVVSPVETAATTEDEWVRRQIQKGLVRPALATLESKAWLRAAPRKVVDLAGAIRDERASGR